MGNHVWSCFGCGKPKNNLNDNCMTCNKSVSRPTEVVSTTNMIQNNVHFHGPFTNTMAEDNERLHAELDQKYLENAQLRSGSPHSTSSSSLGWRLFGFTMAAMTWTGLIGVWFVMIAFAAIITKALQ